MHRILAAAAAVLVLAGCATAPRETGTAAAAPTASLTAPRIDFRQRTLPNGLRVYTVQDRNTANVSVQVWYDVGSKEDPQGRSGFAHLFEHMLFKNTRNMPAETFDRLTEDVGGFNNASTADDYTNYYEVVPANHLERILWAEAERMGNLVVDEAVFRSEREVVKEELRQRVLASPYGRLFSLYMSQYSFLRHPYGRPGIGSIEELDAATIADVRAFHEAFYRPDNAHLIVVGNFDQAELDRWIDRYFGPIERPARPVPRIAVTEPPRTAPRTVTTYAPNVPLPAVLITYPTPKASDADAAPIAVLDAILSAGESSRLYRDLVYEKQVAAQVFSFAGSGEEEAVFALGAVAAGGKSVEEVEAGVLQLVASLRDRPVSAAELSEAKTELVAAALRERETVDGRGDALGRAILLSGDPNRVNTEIADLQAVTAADLQRVARKWLAESQRLSIRYLDESQRQAPATPPPTTHQALTLPPATRVPIVAATEAERVRPPEPGPERPTPTPALAERRLPNGLRVIVAPAGDLPLASLRLTIGAGGAEDPQGKSGVASMTADLMTQGTRTRSAPEIASEAEALGANLGGAAAWDGSSMAVNAPSSNLERAGAILADVVMNPTFAAEELERRRQQSLDALEVTLREPGGVAGLAAPRVVYGAAPYGHQLNGTPASLKTMTRDDLARFHATWWRPDNAALVVTGRVTPEQGFALAQRLFGGWRSPAAALPQQSASRAGPALPPRVVVVDLPNSGQAAVLAALRAIPRRDPAFYPLLVGNSVLGGGYSARLNAEIRVKRGLSYGASSSLSARRDEGLLTASTQTKNESAAEVAGLVRSEIARLSSEPVSAAELGPRKAVLLGQFGRQLETTNGLSELISNLVVNQLPLSELERYAPAIRAVTADEIRAAAARELDPSRTSFMVVGDTKLFLEPLRQTAPNLELIPAAQLNLDSPTLR